MRDLILKIEQWAEDRNLIHGSTPQKQMLKLMEEFGELCSGIAKNNPEAIKDAIGDCFVVMTILNKQLDIDQHLNFDILAGECNPVEQSSYAMAYLGEFVWSAVLLLDEVYIVDSDERLALLRNQNRRFIDLLVGLTSISLHYNLTPKRCLEHAYNQIKDRKGKMINGVFVKEEDLKDKYGTSSHA